MGPQKFNRILKGSHKETVSFWSFSEHKDSSEELKNVKTYQEMEIYGVT